MDTQTMILVSEVVLVNVFILLGIYKYISSQYRELKVEKVKKSILSLEINSIMDKWKDRVKIIPLPDGRIKIDFPEPVMDIDLYFYLSQEEDKVIISDHGEIVKKFNMNRTMNKMMMKRLSKMFGLVYNNQTKCLYLETSVDKLDENMWTMFFAIILLEYASY